MAVTPKKLYENDNTPTVLTTAYTVPSSNTTIIKHVNIANKTSTAATILIKGGGTTIVPTISIAGNTQVTEELSIVLTSLEIIEVQAGTANAIALIISGVEVV